MPFAHQIERKKENKTDCLAHKKLNGFRFSRFEKKTGDEILMMRKKTVINRKTNASSRKLMRKLLE